MSRQERLRSYLTRTFFNASRLHMNLHGVWQLTLDFLPHKSIFVQTVQENISTDAGLLIFRQWDQELRFT